MGEGIDPLWSRVLDALQSSLSPAAIRRIASQSRSLRRTPSELSIQVADGALESWVSQGWIGLQISTLDRLSGSSCSLAILPASTQTLEDFAASPANRLARAHAQEITTCHVPGISIFHGPAGCGKTHLLRAIGRGWDTTQPRPSCAVRDAHELSVELLSALQYDRPARFHSELRDAAVLILDSAEALQGRALTQEQLLAVLELLEPRACPIVLGARSEIFDDACLEPRLRDRLRESQLFRLHQAGIGAHTEIVTQRLDGWGLNDPERAAARIVSRLTPDLGELDRLITSAFSRCRSIADLHHCELPTRPGHAAPSRRAAVDPRAVLRVVCQHFDLRPAELRTSSRSPRVTVPRQIAMYLMRRHSDLSYPEIGQRFHRHHTTGIHAYRRISSESEKSSDLRATLDLLEKELIRLLDEERGG